MRNDAQGLDPSLCLGWGVYAVVANDGRPDKRMVKVGISSNFTKRLMALRTHNPYPLIPVHWTSVETKDDARYLERLVQEHWKWKRYRAQGEWFDMPRGSILSAVDAIDAIADPAYGPNWPLPSGFRFEVTP